MFYTSDSVLTSINVAEKDIELCLSTSAIELFTQNTEDLKPDLGFTAYEFAHLIYACAVIAAHKKNEKVEIEFIQVYNTVKSLTRTSEGQCEIERVAKTFLKCEAYKKLMDNYVKNSK